jgi:predicted DNA-binding ribbon-helix-helix protein
MSNLVNRNVHSGKHRTSIRMEPELWRAVEDICLREDFTLVELVTALDRKRGKRSETGRTSALRVYIIEYFRKAASEGGHAAAGHGARTKVIDTGWRERA